MSDLTISERFEFVQQYERIEFIPGKPVMVRKTGVTVMDKDVQYAYNITNCYEKVFDNLDPWESLGNYQLRYNFQPYRYYDDEGQEYLGIEGFYGNYVQLFDEAMEHDSWDILCAYEDLLAFDKAVDEYHDAWEVLLRGMKAAPAEIRNFIFTYEPCLEATRYLLTQQDLEAAWRNCEAGQPVRGRGWKMWVLGHDLVDSTVSPDIVNLPVLLKIIRQQLQNVELSE